MKLLLAEDELELSKALVTLFKLNNYQVDPVYNGVDAVENILEKEYDAIILDIMMPRIDGLTVLKRIRDEGVKTPVIMLTAKTEIDDKVKGLELGADDYLGKPFSSKELLARIKALIRRGGDVSNPVLKYADISLDSNTFEMVCKDKRVKLVNKEFKLMEMFVLSPNVIYSSDTIIDKVWGLEKDIETNTVWVYISNLRKKLKDLDSKVELISSRYLGYYLSKKND